ncbi:hypothetical protein RI129_011913 [Pyrocoelia pectoralis]|uniref:Core Histone H2A/H2B/H3 domain-containing protein n=1 Tax=Pyrocoelia pectoralis TaxID=417401 RepID=A0AAN7V6M5_9COLE
MENPKRVARSLPVRLTSGRITRSPISVNSGRSQRVTRSFSVSSSTSPAETINLENDEINNLDENEGSRITPKKKKKRPVRLLQIGRKVFRVYKSIIRDIIKLQTSTKLLIPRSSFKRLVKEIIAECSQNDLRIQKLAVEALQEAAEAFLTHLFEDANIYCEHAHRITLIAKDVGIGRFLRNMY